MQYIDAKLNRNCQDGRNLEHDPTADIPDEVSRIGVEYGTDGEPEETHEQALKRVERESYREAAKVFGETLNRYAFFILNHQDPRMAMYIIAYTLQLECAREMTMDEIGRACRLKSRQAVDAEVQKFCNATGYLPAGGMKREQAKGSYKHARIMSILENQEATA